MNFSILKNSWLESLSIFLPQNLKQFILITLKSVKDTFYALYAWPLGLLSYCCFIILIFLFGPEDYSIKLFFASFIFTLLLSAVRPSVDYKNSTYFKHYINFLGPIFSILYLLLLLPYLACNHAVDLYFVILSILILLAIIFEKILNNLPRIVVAIPFFIILFAGKRRMLVDASWICHDYVIVQYLMVAREWLLKIFLIDESWLSRIGIFVYFIAPVTIFWILFMMDSQLNITETFKSIYRAIKMVVYNYPFCLIIFIALKLIIISVSLIYSNLVNLGLAQEYSGSTLYMIAKFIEYIIFVGILLPFYVCFLANFYTKRIHDQFSIYYRE